MATTVQLRRGLAAGLAGASASDGEPLWTTDTHTLYVSQSGTKYLIGPASVALAMPAIFSVSGSPASNGTITVTMATAGANLVLAGPTSGSAAVPAFRALVAADIPSLDTSKLTSGLLAVARGGTATATGAANLVFATPSSSSGAPAFRALVAADVPDTITSGESVLASDFSVNSLTAQTYADTSLTLTLPSAGTYLLMGQVQSTIDAASYGQPGIWISARLKNTTTGTVVPNSECIALLTHAALKLSGSAYLSGFIGTSAGDTITLQVLKSHAFNGQLESNGYGRTALRYLRVTNTYSVPTSLTGQPMGLLLALTYS